MDRLERGLQHVALVAAVTTAHIRIRRIAPDPRDVTGMREVLDKLAHAFATFAPVFAADGISGMPKEISADELALGRFSRGAQVFTSADGKAYRGLTVRRADMESTIGLMKRAVQRED
jgi:hypothetical protein